MSRFKQGTPLIERVLARSVKSGSCTIWVGAKYKSGHGKLKANGKMLRAHRIAFEAKHGPIPDGMLVCHKCDVPNCIDVNHLFLGTLQDNNLDMITKGRHAFGVRNGKSKLTPWRVAVMRRARGGGLSIQKIANKLGISFSTAHSAITGRTWSHLPPTSMREEG